jgi:UDP-N-acetylglucosamine--N-acetylmuramyl-(pentapeptide) pyrophosphoryl-undecaprenol N-acetylglucosamine transferase
VVHEANARAGVANRFAARLTTEVFTASSTVKLSHGVAIGIPLRPAITGLDRTAARPGARNKLGLDADRVTVLVTGGSQGAQHVNAAALGAQKAFAEKGVQVLHIAGPKNPLTAPAREPGSAPYVILPYLDTMADAYAAADFVLCRSGAMTCAELTAVGLPAAYVPLPLRGGEQARNADAIVAAGGALMISDADCTPDWVASVLITTVTDPRRLAAMTTAAAHTGHQDAATVLARRVLELVATHA